MVILEGWAFFYERDTPVKVLNDSPCDGPEHITSFIAPPAVQRWTCRPDAYRS
jgi:hypothetical protein